MSSTKDYLERLQIEKEAYHRIIKDIANNKYGWMITDEEIEDFFEIIELADKEIKEE